MHLYSWNPEFLNRRWLNYQGENVPYLQHVAPDFDYASDAVEIFMHIPDDADPWSYQSETVTDFCKCPTLTELQRTAASEGPIALLYDFNESGQGRLHCGSLTSYELYAHLRKPRIQPPVEPLGVWNQDDHAMECRCEKVDVFNVMRRLFFVTNLSRWAILALATTASSHQGDALRNFLYKHVAYKAGLGVKIRSNSISTFALELHLPYYAWRRSDRPSEDVRGLRSFEDISFLCGAQPQSSRSVVHADYLYEAQFSCLISGWDHEFWTAYAFVDTYFDKLDNRESASRYVTDDEESEFPSDHFDPLTAGTRMVSQLQQDPREYFLSVAEVRIRQSTKEWIKVTSKVLQDINCYLTANPFPIGLGSDSSVNNTGPFSMEASKRKSRQTLAFQRWKRETIALLGKLIKTINDSLNCWEVFHNGDAYYFSRPGAVANISRRSMESLLAIKDAFEEIKCLRESLRQKLDELKVDGSRDWTLHFAQEGNEVSIMQQLTAQKMEGLTRITFFFLPIALAATLLSTQPGYIPLNPSFTTAIILLVVLETIAWLTLDFLSDGRVCSAITRKICKIFSSRDGNVGNNPGQVLSTAEEGLRVNRP